MAEYIDREAVERLVSDACKECREACLEFDGIYADCHQCLFERVKDGVPKIPAADVAPVRHATDIYHKAHGHCEFKCSLCGVEIGVVEGGELDGGKFRYCPGCGAKLDGAE